MPASSIVTAANESNERQKRVLLDIYESFRAENARVEPVSPTVTAVPLPPRATKTTPRANRRSTS